MASSKTCQNCKENFEIDSEDLQFYKKMEVPAPTFCWRCRLARKLIWRNERSLYKRTCDLCEKGAISMYPETTPFPVYCHDCFLSDRWDPMKYGRDYDFSKPFFLQFKELQNVVPRPALYATQNVYSDYCNYTAHLKNCYWLFGSWFSEDCGYGQSMYESKDCWDCLFIKSCESCFASSDCTKCYRTHFSRNCLECTDSLFLYDCRDCQNCIFSFNLRNKNYYAFNKQVTKEEFERIKKETLSSHESLEKAKKMFNELVAKEAIHKFLTGAKNENVSGEFVYNSKNVLHSYYIHNGENEKYAIRGGKGQKDTMDGFGIHGGEQSYECINIDFSSRALFAVNGENHLDTNYVVDCDSVEHLFGCISLRKKKYCILNKEYTENEFNELKSKIIAQMNEVPYVDQKGRTYRYGEFFPFEISAHSYNETLAQEYVPITEEFARDLGYSWQSVEDKKYENLKSWTDLPPSIEGVSDDVLSEIILCQAWDSDKESAQAHRCTKGFRLIPSELAVYRRFGLPLPRQCANTRNFELSKLRNPVNFYERQCACDYEVHKNSTKHEHHPEGRCSNTFETAYNPDQPEIVYCEVCYTAEVA